VVLSAWNAIFRSLYVTVRSDPAGFSSHVMSDRPGLITASQEAFPNYSVMRSAYFLLALAKSYLLKALVSFIAVTLLPRRVPGV